MSNQPVDIFREHIKRMKSLISRYETAQVSHKDFVALLHSISVDAFDAIHPNHTVHDLEASIRKEFNRFGTGVSGQRVIEWAHLHKVTLPHNEHWWFIRERQAEYEKGEAKKSDLLENPPLTGKIDGVPNSWGIPRITNGILVYIELPDGQLFKGHRDNLVWDYRPRSSEKLDSENELDSEEGKVAAREQRIKEKMSKVDLNELAELFK